MEGRFVDENFDSREADAVCSVEFQWTVDTRMPVRFLRYIPAFSYYAIILRDLDPQRLAWMRGAVAAEVTELSRDEVGMLAWEIPSGEAGPEGRAG